MGLDFRRRKLILPSDPTGLHFPRIHSIVTGGLVSWWDFRGGYMTTTLTDRIGSDDGAVANAAAGVFWGDGKRQGIVDGIDEYVDLQNTFQSLIETTAKTIEIWCKSAKTNYTARGRVISFSRTDISTAFMMGVLDTTDNWELTYITGGTTFVSLDSGEGVTTEWTHIVGVQDGTSVVIYINGVAANSANNASAPTMDSPVVAHISAYNNNGTPAQFFDGRLGSARFYSSALTAAQVDQNTRAEQLFYE